MGGRGRQISEFQDSQGYTEKPYLRKTNKQTSKQKRFEFNKKKSRTQEIIWNEVHEDFYG